MFNNYMPDNNEIKLECSYLQNEYYDEYTENLI